MLITYRLINHCCFVSIYPKHQIKLLPGWHLEIRRRSSSRGGRRRMIAALASRCMNGSEISWRSACKSAEPGILPPRLFITVALCDTDMSMQLITWFFDVPIIVKWNIDQRVFTMFNLTSDDVKIFVVMERSQLHPIKIAPATRYEYARLWTVSLSAMRCLVQEYSTDLAG